MKIKGYLSVFLISIFSFILAVFFYRADPQVRGLARQHLEESLAEAYLDQVYRLSSKEDISKTEDTESISGQEDSVSDKMQESRSPYEGSPDFQYEDDKYAVLQGTLYTPDYARGRLFGIIEIPSIKLRRGIYTGTEEEIKYDLDIWMVTVARPDYRTGSTHLCIYGHNSTTQALSFNDLKKVEPGERFYLTIGEEKIIYRVDRIFADWRECITRDYVDNFSLPEEKCYIITCGRDEYRYKDLVVEGTRISPEEKKNDPGYRDEQDTKKETAGASVKTREGHLQVQIKKDQLEIKLILPDRESADPEKTGHKICITDEQGLFIRDEHQKSVILTTDAYGKTTCPLSLFMPGKNYVIGVYDTEWMQEIKVEDLIIKIEKDSSGSDIHLSAEEAGLQKDAFTEIHRISFLKGMIFISLTGVFMSGSLLGHALRYRNREKTG